MSSEAPSSGIDPSLIAAALGDISSDDEPVLPSKRRCRKRKSASPSPPVSPIHKSDSDDEGPSLADRYKERLANEIKKNLEKISNMEKAMVKINYTYTLEIKIQIIFDQKYRRRCSRKTSDKKAPCYRIMD